MRTTAIVPVKRLRDAKRRLGDAVAPQIRASLVKAMLADVLEAIDESVAVGETLVVTNEWDLPVVEVPWTGVPDDLRGCSHSGAARRGVRRAIEAGADCVALLPGDCPLLDPAELDAALRRMRPGRVAIVPDRHGDGTNALFLAPPDAIEPAFGPGSRERHEQLAQTAGHDVAIERLYSLALDLDTAEDLGVLRQALDRNPRLAPRTARVLQEAAPS